MTTFFNFIKRYAVVPLGIVTIVFLVGIFLFSQNCARCKGPDGETIAYLDNFRGGISSSAYKSTTSTKSCYESGSIFTSTQDAKQLDYAEQKAAGKLTCIAEPGRWAVVAPLHYQGGAGWFSESPIRKYCVDSSDSAYVTIGELTEAKCPTAYVDPHSQIFTTDKDSVDCVPQAVMDLWIKNGASQGNIKVCSK